MKLFIKANEKTKNNKIEAIKNLRLLAGLGLKESKDMIEKSLGYLGYDSDTGKYNYGPHVEVILEIQEWQKGADWAMRLHEARSWMDVETEGQRCTGGVRQMVKGAAKLALDNDDISMAKRILELL